MERKQFDVVTNKRLTYTIIMIDNKITRIFNHAHTKNGFLWHYTISPTSETYIKLKRQYEQMIETAFDAVLK